MPKLTKKAILYGRTDGRADPNYRKASLLKIGNKLQPCFSEYFSQTFRTPLKTVFKKLVGVTGIVLPYRNNPTLPYVFYLSI